MYHRVFFFSISIQIFAQRNEVGISLDYTLVPLSDDGIDFFKTSIKHSTPIKFKKGKLVNSFGVDYYKLGYDNSFGIITDDLENIYKFNYNI